MIWKVLEHTADYSFRVFGRDIKSLSINSITALTQSMYEIADLSDCDLSSKEIYIRSLNSDMLIIDILRELLYIIKTEKMLPVNTAIQRITNTDIEILIDFRRIIPADLEKVDIKAITYHKATIRKAGNKLQFDVVCDI